MTEHLTRQALIAVAGQAPGSRRNRHLEECPDCTELVGWLAEFPVAGRPVLASAPANWIHKAIAIGSAERSPGLLTRLQAAVTFDSWAQRLVLGVRGEVQHERRIRFSTNIAAADIRAEQTADGWRFMARLTVAQQSLSGVTLVVDGQLKYPDSAGFVDWAALRPPQMMHIDTSTYAIDLPSVSWDYQK